MCFSPLTGYALLLNNVVLEVNDMQDSNLTNGTVNINGSINAHTTINGSLTNSSQKNNTTENINNPTNSLLNPDKTIQFNVKIN